MIFGSPTYEHMQNIETSICTKNINFVCCRLLVLVGLCAFAPIFLFLLAYACHGECFTLDEIKAFTKSYLGISVIFWYLTW